MLKKRLIFTLAATMLFCSGRLAQASTVSLMPATQTVALGNTVTLDLTMDFTGDPTIGGGVDIFYNSALLQFQSFVFNSGLGDDPGFRQMPTDLGAQLDGLGFGHFFGLSGPSTVGTLSFLTLGTGAANLTLAANDTNLGGFFQSESPFGPQTPDFIGASVDIAAVPIPSTLLLFGSGLIGLVGFSYRRRKETV